MCGSDREREKAHTCMHFLISIGLRGHVMASAVMWSVHLMRCEGMCLILYSDEIGIVYINMLCFCKQPEHFSPHHISSSR